jgi:serine/threonine protein kinase
MGATVYLGRSESCDPSVAAIKVLPKEFVGDGDTTRRFERESGILRGINHENIVEVFDIGIADDGSRYIVMEYLRGGSLAKVLADETRISKRRAVELVSSLCASLSELHSRDITHRDIKPGNVLLAEDGTAKLADFGLARFIDPTTLSNPLTQTGDTLGTLAYMAPEQLGATKKANARSDIYSLGVVLYQLLTGIMPVGNVRPLSEVRPELSHLDAVVTRAIESEPERRFETAREFGEALIQAHEAGRPRLLTRRRILTATAAVGTAAAVGKFWPGTESRNPFWVDLDKAKRRFNPSESNEVVLRAGDLNASFRIHASTTPLSYRLETMDVPEAWLAPLSLSEIVGGKPIGESARCGLKRMEIQIPAAARGTEPPRLSLTNLSAAHPESEEFARLYQSCELLNRLDASGILGRQADRIALDDTQGTDFDRFCEFAGVDDMTASEVATADSARAALIRVGAYQLLKTPAMPPHAAMAEGDDFSVDLWEARTRLDVVAAMIAEPWILSRAESVIRPIYDAQKPDSPATQIVGEWLGIV